MIELDIFSNFENVQATLVPTSPYPAEGIDLLTPVKPVDEEETKSCASQDLPATAAYGGDEGMGEDAAVIPFNIGSIDDGTTIVVPETPMTQPGEVIHEFYFADVRGLVEESDDEGTMAELQKDSIYQKLSQMGAKFPGIANDIEPESPTAADAVEGLIGMLQYG